MPRSKKPSFVVDLPLKTTAAEESVLATRLEAARQIYNACLGEALSVLRGIRESRRWQRARAMPKGQARRDLFAEVRDRFDFCGPRFDRSAIRHKNNAFSMHLGSDDTQKVAQRAYEAVKEYAVGKRGKPRFKGRRGLHSVEGKKKAVIVFRKEKGTVCWTPKKGSKLELAVQLDESDPWLVEAMAAHTKYSRILRRRINGRDRWFVQLVQEGHPPKKAHHIRPQGVVGLDVGPSTVAVVGEKKAVLEGFCPSVVQPWQRLKQVQRAMDRSRRATNPENYNPDGTVKKGAKRWTKSRRYRRLAVRRAEIERRLAAERKRAHGELANAVLAMGTTVRTEKLSYRSFQKNFGRSVKVRGPGMFISMLKRKAESAGGSVEEFPTRTTCLSQFCHGCGQLRKKPLALRIHQCECGVGPVQRDLYSAFLARHVRDKKLDASQALEAWPDVEPLLRRAASSNNQLASGRASAAPQVRASERVVRQSWEEAPPRPQMAYRLAREGCGEVRKILRTPRL